LDYFSENVPPIKFFGEKSKAVTLMMPLISCARHNFFSLKIASAEVIVRATISSVGVMPYP
jgi:hypothetical protein